MAIVPVEGKPGQFLNTETNKIFEIIEWREDDIYDTSVVGAPRVSPTLGAAFGAGKKLTFFTGNFYCDFHGFLECLVSRFPISNERTSLE